MLANENMDWYKNTLFCLVLFCCLSQVVGDELVHPMQPKEETPCEGGHTTADFSVLKKLEMNESCESILRQYSCESGYVKACIRNYNHSFLVAVCTKNICLNDWACAEYQMLNTPVITAHREGCPNCSKSSTLEGRMETGEGNVCLKLIPHSTPQPTTATRNQATAGPQTSMANIYLMVGLIIPVVMKHLC